MKQDLPKSEAKRRRLFPIESECALLLPDMHFPYQSNTAINAALLKGKREKVDTVIMTGDQIDFYGLSRFSKDPERKNVKYEVSSFRKFLCRLRADFPRANIYYMQGNHCERLEKYIIEHAPALKGVIGTDLSSVLDLQKFKVKLVEAKAVVTMGPLSIIHGHEYPGITFSKNPSMVLLPKAKVHAIIGHCHRKSDYTERTLRGKSIACWSMGCLCDLSPDFMPYNNWVHGFAIIKYTNEHFSVRNYYISHDGKVY